ncbi:hypothetical protein [Microbacterium sp. No. 7]|uniref:hypothetical protein n=1 Tax=Microbacterium sp. No. 7 TaxID=1714373 RepID=UPI0006ECE866|nr:hypothetical protein [Microbacterium sp. No. 7]ALJ20544.1 hypothetical protein AOA12_11770 [Microbacterium sp. No. 7]
MTKREMSGAAPGRVERRTVLQSAAWAMPALAMTIGVPRAAATTCTATPVSHATPALGAAVPKSTKSDLTGLVVPAGFTKMTFELVGGGSDSGGGAPAGMYLPGRVKGTLDVGPTAVIKPGDVLALQAGGMGLAAGTGGDSSYGKGGNSGTLVSGKTDGQRGSGGGGASALLVNGIVLVVAGGAGGAGRLQPWFITDLTAGTGNGAGTSNAGAVGVDGHLYELLTSGIFGAIYGTAGGGKQGGVGTGGVATSGSGTGWGVTDARVNGGGASGNNGGTGANAGSVGGWWNDSGNSGGGGGGGYGGGGGGSSFTRRNDPLWTFRISGGGGGGGNLVPAGATASGGPYGAPGSVTVTFHC